MTVQWELVKRSQNGPTLWKRTDTRNRYAPMDTNTSPGSDCYGTSRLNAMRHYIIKCDRVK